MCQEPIPKTSMEKHMQIYPKNPFTKTQSLRSLLLFKGSKPLISPYIRIPHAKKEVNKLLDMADSSRVEKDTSDFMEYNQKINLNKTADLGRNAHMSSPKVSK